MKVKTNVKAGQAPLINLVIGNFTSPMSSIDNRAGGAGILAIGGTFNEA
jgi:hypothetical protein